MCIRIRRGTVLAKRYLSDKLVKDVTGSRTKKIIGFWLLGCAGKLLKFWSYTKNVSGLLFRHSAGIMGQFLIYDELSVYLHIWDCIDLYFCGHIWASWLDRTWESSNPEPDYALLISFDIMLCIRHGLRSSCDWWANEAHRIRIKWVIIHLFANYLLIEDIFWRYGELGLDKVNETTT